MSVWANRLQMDMKSSDSVGSSLAQNNGGGSGMGKEGDRSGIEEYLEGKICIYPYRLKKRFYSELLK